MMEMAIQVLNCVFLLSFFFSCRDRDPQSTGATCCDYVSICPRLYDGNGGGRCRVEREFGGRHKAFRNAGWYSHRAYHSRSTSECMSSVNALFLPCVYILCLTVSFLYLTCIARRKGTLPAFRRQRQHCIENGIQWAEGAHSLQPSHRRRIDCIWQRPLVDRARG